MVPEIFLTACLALPLHTNSDYWILKSFLESQSSKYEIVFVNDKERLLNKGAVRTPFYVGQEWLRTWGIKRSA